MATSDRRECKRRARAGETSVFIERVVTRACQIHPVRPSRRRAPRAPAYQRACRLAAIWQTPVRWRLFAAAHKRKVVMSPLAGSSSNAWNVNFNNCNTNNNDVSNNNNNVRCVR